MKTVTRERLKELVSIVEREIARINDACGPLPAGRSSHAMEVVGNWFETMETWWKKRAEEIEESKRRLAVEGAAFTYSPPNTFAIRLAGIRSSSTSGFIGAFRNWITAARKRLGENVFEGCRAVETSHSYTMRLTPNASCTVAAPELIDGIDPIEDDTQDLTVGHAVGAPHDDPDRCPICDEPFEPADLCATDVELGTCHAACLEGSPVVDLDTGEPSDGPIGTYRYDALGTVDGSGCDL